MKGYQKASYLHFWPPVVEMTWSLKRQRIAGKYQHKCYIDIRVKAGPGY